MNMLRSATKPRSTAHYSSSQLPARRQSHLTLLLTLILSCLQTLLVHADSNTASSSQASTSQSSNNDAALLTAITYKLSKFITWPPLNQNRFNICHYGNRELSTTLSSLEQRTINDKPVKVHPISSVSFELTSCQILFINDTDTEQTRKLLLSVSRSPVLTLSNINRFTDFGGMIELSRQGQRYHFLINLKAARNAGIQVASPLLELSTVVAN